MNSKIERLVVLKRQCFNCKKCPISQGDTRVASPHVFGCGNINARIVVVGQNPGYNETIIKKPFVGAAGKNFDQMLQQTLGVDRNHIYITNTIKCYTPGNRAPTDEEVYACKDFLKQEIGIIQPEIIVVLGNYALQYFTKHAGMTNSHGKLEKSAEFGINVFPMYHPSPLNMNKVEIKKQAEEDFIKLKQILNGSVLLKEEHNESS